MKKRKVKIYSRIINDHSWVNNTWLAPYCGYEATLLVYSNRNKSLLLDGVLHPHVEGFFTAPNGWRYKIEKMLNPTHLGTYA